MRHFFFLFILTFISCQSHVNDTTPVVESVKINSSVQLVILGNVQDGGSPHIGCKKDCCSALWAAPDLTRKVVSLGLIDHKNQKKYLFEATPNITGQLHLLSDLSNFSTSDIPDGIFITHAHLGHYTGLSYLGREAKGATKAPVFLMPKMEEFIKTNGPWNQLIKLENIAITHLSANRSERLTDQLKVIPFLVPHRDEFSETVGYKIIGPSKTALFIPDIDKWSKWDTDITDAIKQVDYAFLDGTFFNSEEINHRDISEIPHPFISESMDHFKNLPDKEKDKIYFIHFNHTNPILQKNSAARLEIEENGFHIADFKMEFEL